MSELTNEEMCFIFGHRMRLIGRTADGKGVRRCKRCGIQDREEEFVLCRPGRITT